jgi:YHS domain-containing protein
MVVDPEKARDRTEYQGKTYHFCAPGCKQAFEKDPERYTEKAPRGGCPGCCGC